MKYLKLTKQFLVKEYVQKQKPAILISEKVGCHLDTIFYYLKKYNIKSRTISEANKGKKFTIKHRNKLSKAKLGKKHPHTIQQNKKIGKALKGRKIFWANKISKAHKGKKCSKTHRNKLIKILKKAVKNGLNVTKFVNHHIYLKENSKKTLKMTRISHRKLHARAYNYIYAKYGEKGINSYINWFFDNYGDN